MQLSREIFQHCIKICRILKVVNLPHPLSLCSSSYRLSLSPSLPSWATHSASSSLITLITTRNWKEDSFVKKGWVRDGNDDGAGGGGDANLPPPAVAPSPPPPPLRPAANGSGGHLAGARREGRLAPPPPSPFARVRLCDGEESSGFFPPAAPRAGECACAVAVVRAFGRPNEQMIWVGHQAKS